MRVGHLINKVLCVVSLSVQPKYNTESGNQWNPDQGMAFYKDTLIKVPLPLASLEHFRAGDFQSDWIDFMGGVRHSHLFLYSLGPMFAKQQTLPNWSCYLNEQL